MKEHEKKEIKKELLELAEIQIEMQKNEVDLLDKIFEKQDRIVRKFGINFPLGHEEMLEFDAKPSDQKLEETIAYFEKEAKLLTHQLDSNYGDLLREAIEKKLDAEEVLPVLDVPLNPYTVFVYGEMLLHEREHYLEVAKALRCIHGYKILLSLMALTYPDELSKKEEEATLGFLKYLGIRYLDEYVALRDEIREIFG